MSRAHELHQGSEYYDRQVDSSEHLRDSLESAWDQVEESDEAIDARADHDWTMAEIGRKGLDRRDLLGLAYDKDQERVRERERWLDENVEAVGRSRKRVDPVERVAVSYQGEDGKEDLPDGVERFDDGMGVDATAARLAKRREQGYVRDATARAWDDSTKPAETEGPEAAAVAIPQEATAEDRAVLSRMTPDDQRYLLNRFASLDSPLNEADHAVLSRLSAEDRRHVLRRAQEVAGQQQARPAPAAAPAYLPPPPQPTGNEIADRLQRDAWQEQAARAHQARNAPPPGPSPEAVAVAEARLKKFAESTDDSGALRYPLFRELVPYIGRGAQQARAAGMTVDEALLDKLYRSALQSSPEAAAMAHAAGANEVRKYQARNPVAFEPGVRDRMNSLARGARRAGKAPRLNSLLSDALAMDPTNGGRPGEPATVRQTLEALWDAAA